MAPPLCLYETQMEPLLLKQALQGFERLKEVFIIPTVITDQPSVPIDTDLNIPEGGVTKPMEGLTF